MKNREALHRHGEIAKKLAKEIPLRLSDDSLSAEDLSHLFNALNSTIEDFENFKRRLDSDEDDEHLLSAANSLEAIYDDLAEAVATRLIRSREG